MTTHPVQLDRLQAGMVSLVLSKAPGSTVTWSPTAHPRGDLYFTLRLVAGPSPTLSTTYDVTLPLSVTVEVAGSLVEGDTLRLCLSGDTISVDVRAGDTHEIIRDRLLALVLLSLNSVTASAVGADALTITALEYGDIYGVALSGPGTVTLAGSQLCKMQLGTARSEVELQAYSRSRYPMDGAEQALSRIVHSLRLPSLLRIQEDYDITIEPSNVVDLTALTGPEWESRSAVTLSVHQPATSAELVSAIQASTVASNVLE